MNLPILFPYIAFLAVATAGARLESAVSRYIPPAWYEMCTTTTTLNESVQVEVRCSVPRDQKVQWRLNDLRAWTASSVINADTTPDNRTVVYFLRIECATGANISLPWPMRVKGLRKLQVFSCQLLDRDLNQFDTTEAAIGDDMVLLEIRHSVWIVDMIANILKASSDLMNLTSDFDCGQDSSLEAIITSNVSDIIQYNQNADVTRFKNQVTTISDQPTSTLSAVKPLTLGGDLSSIGPAKPEDRLTNDTSKAVSDQNRILSEQVDKSRTITTTPVQSALESDDSQTVKDRQAEMEFIRMMQLIRNKDIKCKYPKLKLIDESIARVTPVHHFETMVMGSDFPVLENMNYSYIGLREMPDELAQWPIYFPKLTWVDLTHNYLSEFRIPNFPSISSSVTQFDLRFNNITTLSIDMITSWASAEKTFLNITDNPIDCTCALAPFLNRIQDGATFTGQMERYEYVKNLPCHTPLKLSGRHLYRLTLDDLDCPSASSHNNNATIITLCFVLGFLIVLIIVVFRYKMEIRILLYTRLHVRLPWDTDIEKCNKTFDAFVSYSNEDYSWVWEHLVRFLENPSKRNPDPVANEDDKTAPAGGHNSLRLCIHQRDFVPGKPILDNIVDSIEASRHTIIVLSPNFIRSEWSMEELRQAYKQSLVEKNRHLIIILLEKVSKDMTDPLVRRCCKTFTYLEAQDTLFKDRLLFSLTTRSKTNSGVPRIQAAKESPCSPRGALEKKAVKDPTMFSIYMNLGIDYNKNQGPAKF